MVKCKNNNCEKEVEQRSNRGRRRIFCCYSCRDLYYKDKLKKKLKKENITL